MEIDRGSDVGTTPFEPWPDPVDLHVEWGPAGARLAAARGDLVVIVDVLSFSTSVVLTSARGGIALSYSDVEIDQMGGRRKAADRFGAEIVAKDREATTGRFSLSPASLGAVTRGDRLIFTSLNGAACSSAASAAPLVLVGALTNRTATARAIEQALSAGVATRCTIVPCGERWTSVSGDGDSLRPSVEDLLGAGAICDALSHLRLSCEAELAAATFAAAEPRLPQRLAASVSGRELIERGFGEDVELAAALDDAQVVPAWDTRSALREYHRFDPEPGR